MFASWIKQVNFEAPITTLNLHSKARIRRSQSTRLLAENWLKVGWIRTSSIQYNPTPLQNRSCLLWSNIYICALTILLTIWLFLEDFRNKHGFKRTHNFLTVLGFQIELRITFRARNFLVTHPSAKKVQRFFVSAIRVVQVARLICLADLFSVDKRMDLIFLLLPWLKYFNVLNLWLKLNSKGPSKY